MQKEKVEDFFNKSSREYKNKYTNTNLFLYYFFNQRLTEATHQFSFEEKSILDIGAGTGALYDSIKSTTTNFNYFATDISPKMLEQSNIASNQYFVGDISEFSKESETYDLIFLLGVTTYYNQQELKKHLEFINNRLDINGTAIISFTNRNSIDYQLIKLGRFFAKFLSLKKNVVGQSFKVYAYTPGEITQTTNPKFSIQKTTFLNQTIWPFNRIFPKTSISIARFLKKNISSPSLLSVFSSDFLIFIKKKEI